MSKGMLAVLLALLMVLVASGIFVSAADAAVPGDWMYGMDRAMDGLRLRLAWNAKEKAQIERQLAQERLREAQTLARRGEPSNAELLRQESRASMLAAIAADPQSARKTEKATIAATQVEQNEQRLERKGQVKGNPNCNGTATKHDPAGEKLAQHLGVSYSEVMSWYCQGYDFSEITLAYRISRVKGVTVEEVFARRASGLGWEKILQKYGLNGKEE